MVQPGQKATALSETRVAAPLEEMRLRLDHQIERAIIPTHTHCHTQAFDVSDRADKVNLSNGKHLIPTLSSNLNPLGF